MVTLFEPHYLARRNPVVMVFDHSRVPTISLSNETYLGEDGFVRTRSVFKEVKKPDFCKVSPRNFNPDALIFQGMSLGDFVLHDMCNLDSANFTQKLLDAINSFNSTK